MSASPQPAWDPNPEDDSTLVRRLALVRDDANWQLWPRRTTIAPPALASGSGETPGRTKLLLGAAFVVCLFIKPGLALLGLGGMAAVALYRSQVSSNGVRPDDYLAHWAAERGLTSIASPGTQLTRHQLRVDNAWLEARLSPMRRAGVRNLLRRGDAVTGALWTAAPNATLAQVRLSDGEDPLDLAFVSIPLAPEVVPRYAGIVVELGGRARRMLSVTGGVVRLGWQLVGFEQHANTLGFEVHVAPTQDRVAVHELVDPAFLEQLAARAATVKRARCGVVVADGQLFVWSASGLLEYVGRAGFRAARSKPLGGYAHAEHDLEQLVLLARDMHRRIVAAWD